MQQQWQGWVWLGNGLIVILPPLLVQCKIWVKPSSEMSFLYGNHILKSGLGRITDSTPQYQGVVVYSMSDLPLVSS